jgi:hypothetical protein
MTGVITVTHSFVSLLEDSSDAEAAGELVPSNWNDEHVVTGAAPIDSPAFVGMPTAPTPDFGDTSDRIATMAALAAASGSVPQQTLTAAGNVTIAPGIALVIARKTVPAAFTITLPLSTALLSEQITIKDRMLANGAGAGTFNIMLAAQGTETLDGATTMLLDVDNMALSFKKIRDDSGNVTGEGYYLV